MRKNLDPNLNPEIQHTLPKQGSMERLHVCQGRAGSRRKKPNPINHAINQASNLTQKVPGRTEIETRRTNHVHSTHNANDKMANTNPLIPDGAFHPGPVYRHPPKPIKQNMTHAQSSQSSNIDNNNSNINFDFEENSPFHEGIMSKTFQRLDKSFFQEPTELGDRISKGNIIHKYLPKQTDIDSILEIILYFSASASIFLIAGLEDGNLFCDRYKYKSLKYGLCMYPACISLISTGR